MASYANTSTLDANAEAYSDAEEAASGSDAAESEDSGDYHDSGDDDDDDDDSDGGERRIPPGVRFTGFSKAIFADTSSSDASSDSGLAEFDEQAPTTDTAKTGASSDPAKTGETSSRNEQAGEASDPAGSESMPQTESQMATPEASDIAKPPSPTPAAAPTEEAHAEETHAEETHAESTPDIDPATANVAST